jgi:hypothetical protein
MREYVDVTHVSNVSSDKFEKELREAFLYFQNEGYEVEIQNGNTTNVYSAIVLAYLRKG